jgi:hypothetical protein|nr:MAG TPA: hypothetical protein [Caudoviricetes sp.]
MITLSKKELIGLLEDFLVENNLWDEFYDFCVYRKNIDFDSTRLVEPIKISLPYDDNNN